MPNIQHITLLISCAALVGVVLLAVQKPTVPSDQTLPPSISSIKAKAARLLKAKWDIMSADERDSFIADQHAKRDRLLSDNKAKGRTLHAQQLAPPIETSTWSSVLMDEQQRACMSTEDANALVDPAVRARIEDMLYAFDSIVEGVYTNDFNMNLNLTQLYDYLLEALTKITTPGFLTTSYGSSQCDNTVYNMPVLQLSFAPHGFLDWANLIKYFDTGDNAANLHMCYRWYDKQLGIVALSEKVPAFGPSALFPTAFTYIGVHNYFWIYVPQNPRHTPKVAFWNEQGNDYRDFSSPDVTDAYGVTGTGQGCWGRDVLLPNCERSPDRPWCEGKFRSRDLYVPTANNIPLALPAGF